MIYAKKILLLVALVSIIPVGCTSINDGVIQKSSNAFLWFTGNTKDAEVYIDNNAPISVDDFSIRDVHYQIPSGKHSIVVKRFGTVIVNRRILLGSGITKEIQIP